MWFAFIWRLGGVCSLVLLFTLFLKWYVTRWRHYHITLSMRDKAGCVCVYVSVLARDRVCVCVCMRIFMYPCMCVCVWAICQWAQTAVGERALWLAYQRYWWNVLSWQAASARCDPSRTVCSCPMRASSSERKTMKWLIKRQAWLHSYKSCSWDDCTWAKMVEWLGLS